jgi:hypothetical protein
MAFVTAYFDESYSSPNPSVHAVGGYISTDRRWAKFQKAWMGLLKQEVQPRWRKVYGPDKPLFFHMTDFDNPHSKIYGDWKEAKKIWFLRELHKVIKKAYIRSFASGVIIADYDALSDEQKYVIGSPHLFVAINCAKQIAGWAQRENRQHPILYVFEKGHVEGNDLKNKFSDLSPEMRQFYRMTELDSFALMDKRMSPLHAADVLAFEVRKEMERRLQEPNNRRETRKSIRNLHTPMLDEWNFIGKPELLKLFANEKVREAMADEIFRAKAAAFSKWKAKKGT